jgi:ribosome-associated protein
VRSEGISESQWVLLDYGDVVVHVFAEETRRFYEIERLYRDRPSLNWRSGAIATQQEAAPATGAMDNRGVSKSP